MIEKPWPRALLDTFTPPQESSTPSLRTVDLKSYLVQRAIGNLLLQTWALL